MKNVGQTVNEKRENGHMQFVNEIESQPVEVREKQPQSKRMPKVSSWRCSKCGQKGHVKSACKGKGNGKAPALGANPRTLEIDFVIARLEEEITDQEKVVSSFHDEEAYLRALRRLRARIGGAV